MVNKFRKNVCFTLLQRIKGENKFATGNRPAVPLNFKNIRPTYVNIMFLSKNSIKRYVSPTVT